MIRENRVETTGVLAVLLKYGWMFISGVMFALFGWLFRKANDTYSKQEVEKLFELKMEPLKQSVDRLTQSTERSAAIMEKLNDNLNKLHTDVAVIKHQVSKLEEK